VSYETLFPTTSERIVSALRWGGYASFIPCIFESPWDGPVPPLAGFPISVCFTGLRQNENRAKAQHYVVACYWFDPRSYCEDDELRRMTYRSKLASKYHVVIKYLKRDRRWEGQKLRDGEVIIDASGPELFRFMIQLTMPGVDPVEPVEPLLTRCDTASAGIWIFRPDNPQVRKVQ
jgi:hypothetical protein